MDVYELKSDMRMFCITAKSFPYDIKGAFATLINMLPTIDDRTFFGISYQSVGGDIIYKAAVLESFEGEGANYGCETFTIKKGEYVAETLKNWKKNEASIGLTFRKLAEARLDTTFPCVEWYQGNDVMCMVKIDKSLIETKTKNEN